MAALVGGWDGKRELASAKLLTFDGSAKGMRWEALPELPAPVVNPALTADAEGRLLVCGGKRGGNPLRDVLAFAASTGRWEPFSQLRIARDGARAVLLHDGRVLVIGGSRGATDLASCETFDPATGRWIGGPSMHSGRRSFGAAVMPDGRVVVAGGFGGAGTEQAVGGGSGDPAMEVHVSRTPLAQLRDRLDSAEVFDPSTNRCAYATLRARALPLRSVVSHQLILRCAVRNAGAGVVVGRCCHVCPRCGMAVRSVFFPSTSLGFSGAVATAATSVTARALASLPVFGARFHR